MVIAIPCNKDGYIEKNSGSAPFFTVFDTEKGGLKVVENGNIIEENARCNPAGAVLSLKVDALLCREVSLRTARMLSAYGVRVFFTGESAAERAVTGFLAGDFRECVKCGSGQGPLVNAG